MTKPKVSQTFTLCHPYFWPFADVALGENEGRLWQKLSYQLLAISLRQLLLKVAASAPLSMPEDTRWRWNSSFALVLGQPKCCIPCSALPDGKPDATSPLAWSMDCSESCSKTGAVREGPQTHPVWGQHRARDALRPGGHQSKPGYLRKRLSVLFCWLIMSLCYGRCCLSDKIYLLF